MDAMDGINY